MCVRVHVCTCARVSRHMPDHLTHLVDALPSHSLSALNLHEPSAPDACLHAPARAHRALSSRPTLTRRLGLWQRCWCKRAHSRCVLE